MNPSNSGYDRFNIGTIGTTVIRAIPSVLHTIVPEVSVGTVTLHDSATAAGTTAANRILTFTGGTAASQNFPIVLDYQCKAGLVYVGLGTPIAVLTLI